MMWHRDRVICDVFVLLCEGYVLLCDDYMDFCWFMSYCVKTICIVA
jgi:hypothetical protein